MIEEGLRGRKQGKGDRWCEGGGMQRPATGGDRDGLILQADDQVRGKKKTRQVYPANEN